MTSYYELENVLLKFVCKMQILSDKHQKSTDIQSRVVYKINGNTANVLKLIRRTKRYVDLSYEIYIQKTESERNKENINKEKKTWKNYSYVHTLSYRLSSLINRIISA